MDEVRVLRRECRRDVALRAGSLSNRLDSRSSGQTDRNDPQSPVDRPWPPTPRVVCPDGGYYKREWQNARGTDINRRKYIAGFGTVGVCAAGVGLAYQLDRGAISLGEDAELSETVSRSSESFEFEVVDGAEIYVTITDTRDAPYRGAFALHDPDGNEVLHGGPRSSKPRNEAHTAESGGTYRLVVDPQGTSLNGNVHVRDPGE
jgi:hypothetical protein